ncbi:MAG: hypothetical protein OCU16_03590 [Candidatus Methanospirare jalkutatii]|nr:hypothetical protein [Candidatus Methanospirare jalkutatii]
MVYAPSGIRERCPNANVHRCIKVCVVCVFAMLAEEICTGSQTLRTAEMACL